MAAIRWLLGQGKDIGASLLQCSSSLETLELQNLPISS